MTDVNPQKLEIAASFDGVLPVDITTRNLQELLNEHTRGWGANIVIEASGASALYPQLIEYCAPGARLVIVGIPEHPVPLDITEMQKREVEVKTVNRYCNVYERAIDFVASGKINVKKLIGKEFDFDQAIEAFDYVAKGGNGEVKVQIALN